MKIYLDKNKIQQRQWNEVDTTVEINEIIGKLRLQEKTLLPVKKRRALSVAEKILTSAEKKLTIKHKSKKELIRNLLTLFKPELNNDTIIDYDNFAEIWLTVLQPALHEKRNKQIRKRRIITLRDLTEKDLKLEEVTLQNIYDNCQAATTLDEMIAACIIAIRK